MQDTEDRVYSVLNKDKEFHFLKETFLRMTICSVFVVSPHPPPLGYPDFKPEVLVRADLKRFHSISFHHRFVASSILF